MAVSIHGNNGFITTNGTAAAPSFAAPDNDTGLYFGTNLIHATTSGTNRFNIDANGRVLIGLTSSTNDNTLTLQGSSGGNYNSRLELRRGGNPSDGQALGTIYFANNAGKWGAGIYAAAAENWTSGSAHGTDLVFQTADNTTTVLDERARILDNGNFGIGTNAPASKLHVKGGSVYVDNTGNPFVGTRYNAGADGAVLFLQHSRSGTIGTKVKLNDNDEIGTIQFRAYASDNSTIKHAASIKAEVNGTPSANGVPTDLIFNTGTTSANANEKLRIKSTGEVLIATRNSGSGGDHGFRFGSFGIRTQDTGGYNYWHIDRNYGGWQSNMISLKADGKVGINQAVPERILHVGSSGTAEANIRIQGGADYGEIRVKDSDNELSFHHNVGGAGSRELFSANGSTGHFSINCYSYQALTITTNENGTNGPEIQLIHNTASPAANDIIGQLRFSGKDSAGNTEIYSKIETKVDDPTSGSETGHLNFATKGLGSFANVFRIKRRSTASAPSYTADDADGVILDIYNTGNPYPRYMNFIAKSGGNTDSNITFWTEAVGGSPTEKLRITAAGKVLIGGGSSPSQVGDGQLIVYGDTRLHPAIKADCIDGGVNRANGYTMLADNYAADESMCNIGVAYSSGSLVLSRGCKVSNTSDTGYISSIDSFAIRPCALRIDDMGALSFHTKENAATTTTDSAVSLTEVFHVDRVGNIYQRITNRYMFFGASNQLKIGIVSSDPVIDATSGHLQLKKNGSTICTVRDDHLQMYGDIKMNNDKGISFINADDTATGETVSSSVLDDYEEGSWTPDLMDGQGSNVTWNNGSNCRYVKVGRMVYCYFRVTRAETGSKTGAMRFYNLPYAATNSTFQITGTWWLDEGGVSQGDAVGGAVYVVENQRQAYFVYPTTEWQQASSRYLQFSEWTNLRPIYGAFTYEAAA